VHAPAGEPGPSAPAALAQPAQCLMAAKAAVVDESYMVVLGKKKKHAYVLANNLLSAGGPADMMAAVAYVIMTRSGHKARLDRAAAATMKAFHEVARLDAEAVRFPRLAAWKVAHGAKQAHSCRWRGCMRTRSRSCGARLRS
jgi:hypothetical protein